MPFSSNGQVEHLKIYNSQVLEFGDQSVHVFFGGLLLAPPCTPSREHTRALLDAQALQFVLLENPCVKETIKKKRER